MNPWDRQGENGELEPILWFGRLTAFRLMGTGRSLLGLYRGWLEDEGRERQKKPTRAPQSWHDAAEKWDWRPRAEAWDVAEIERQQEQFRADCDEWRTERFKDARALRNKARQYLSLPVVEQTTKKADEDGNPVLYVIAPLPPRTLRAAASAFKIADELARITTRETLPKVEMEHTGKDGEPINFIVTYEEEL